MVIPDWLREHVPTNCAYCGAEIIDNELLTDRYCSNPKCPEHMAHKIVVLAKRFGVKQFGIAAARELVKYNNFYTHTLVLKKWFSYKPSLYLHEVGEICMIKGHQKRWREYCDKCDNMKQVLSKPSVPKEVKDHRAELIITEGLCDIKPRLLGMTVNVMLSGSFEGYRARADFISEMNRKFGDIVQLVDVGRRKTSVDYLVKEAYATDHEKSAIAAEYGIMVLTPKQLEEKLAAYCTYIYEGRNSP